MIKMYIITILVIIFQLSNQLFLNYIINKQIAGYKPDTELMEYIYSKTPKTSMLYFGNKIINIISLFVITILYVILVVKGTFYDFKDHLITKEKSFKNILVSIVIFLFIAIFTSLFGTISRLFLPSEKYGEISVVDTILNIDSILLYFSSNKDIKYDDIKNNDFKLSNNVEELNKIFNDYPKPVNDTENLQNSADPFKNLYENLYENICGDGLYKNLSIIVSLALYGAYIFVVFVLLFNHFESSYSLHPNNINIYGNLYKTFLSTYIIMFSIYGLIFISICGYNIYNILCKCEEKITLINLFKNNLFIFMFVIWIILLIFVIVFGVTPNLKDKKGSKTFMYIGIVIVVVLFMIVAMFLFEPIRRIFCIESQKILQTNESVTTAISSNLVESLRDKGPDAHLLRGLLGSIGVDSDLLQLIENTPYTDEQIKELEEIVIKGLADKTHRARIIQKLKETHIKNRGITKTIDHVEQNNVET